MWVRTTMSIQRWTKEKTEDNANTWEENSSDVSRLPSWEGGHLLTGVACSTDASTFSEGDSTDADRCCWKHKQCSRHIFHPFTSDCAHHDVHLHSISHCDCDSRLMDCSEKTNSGSSQDVGSPCFNIIQSPCFGLIPEEECVERFWYSWCKGYRPISVAVIHHPLHHDYGADDLNEEEEEEEEAASQPPIPAQVVPAATPTDICMSTVSVPSDLVAPITIWRSESPRGESQGSRVIKKVKKTKEKEKDKETEEKVKLKKKVKKDKVTKKKSPIKSGPSPPDLSRLTSPRESAGMSESSPDSRRDLDSENSYSDPRWEEPSSEDVVESLSPRKKENTVQAKKPGVKALPVKKVIKRKSPPASNPNLS
ncbi:protein PROCA1 isoform X3 [Manis javanica]|uniref:protein PROCA1 isoform X3 n=1 Tax=Manis javanica TaxID=9974 RepID=UPI003C6CEC0F